MQSLRPNHRRQSRQYILMRRKRSPKSKLSGRVERYVFAEFSPRITSLESQINVDKDPEPFVAPRTRKDAILGSTCVAVRRVCRD